MSFSFGEHPDALPPSTPPSQADLNPADTDAMEALLAAELDPSRVEPAHRERAGRMARVLGLLDRGVDLPDKESLIDATLARVRLAAQPAAEHAAPEYALTVNDEDAFESLVAAGYRAELVPAALRKRATRVSHLLDLLGTENGRPEADASGGLISRTLSRVQSAADDQRSRMRLEVAPVGGRRIRMADLMTVAALLLIATAAVGPMVGAMREQSRRMACQSNLQAAGIGFGSYAAEYKDKMPMATASLAGNPWWTVGQPEHSNSANLFTLARTGYSKVGQLACPGNPDARRTDLGPDARDWRSLGEVSYSYQNLFGRPRAMFHDRAGARTLLIVDGSPVVRRAVRGEFINPLANSMNHAGKGQNALFSDGSVQWITSPVLGNGDNIWLPRMIEDLLARLGQPARAEPIKGTETPAGVDDRFVGP